jgi:tellurite resistance protein TerA
MTKERTSFDSIREATEDKSLFSGHGTAKGVAGYHDSGNIIAANPDFLSESGQNKTLSIPEGRFPSMRVTLSWNNIVPHAGLLARLMGRTTGIDLDLGCLYELTDGTRGSVQAFGNDFGAIDKPPYIKHTGDERTGNTPGIDESLIIDGNKWENIKRFLVYAYIYEGPTNWRAIKPEIRLVIPDQTPMIVTLAAPRSDLPVCALATVENVDNGVKLTNHSEYFSSHPAMDRAFGYGLRWEDGTK